MSRRINPKNQLFTMSNRFIIRFFMLLAYLEYVRVFFLTIVVNKLHSRNELKRFIMAMYYN